MLLGWVPRTGTLPCAYFTACIHPQRPLGEDRASWGLVLSEATPFFLSTPLDLFNVRDGRCSGLLRRHSILQPECAHASEPLELLVETRIPGTETGKTKLEWS
ncbi:hypothetical protein RSAG8_08785, partial [Rhizoctonia solani AG-8 WAC10335]